MLSITDSTLSVPIDVKMCPQCVSSCVLPQKVCHVLILTQNAVPILSRAFAHSSYVSRWIDVERCPDCVYLSHVSPTDGM